MREEKREITPMTMQTLREIKLNESDKQKIAILFGGIIVALAISVLIFDSIFPHPNFASSYYPGNCGSGTAQNLASCLTTLAAESGNVSICAYMQGSQSSSCITSVAERANNAATCGYLTKQDPYYSTCISAVEKSTGNIALCGGLSLAPAFTCMYNSLKAYNFSTASLCQQIPNSSYSQACFSLVYYTKALNGSNPAYCQMLQNVRNYTALAFMNYNATTASVPAGYAYLYSLGATPQGFCYLGLALQEMNGSLCNRIIGNFSTTCSYYVEAANESLVVPNYNATNVTAACSPYRGSSMSYCSLQYQTNLAIKEVNVSKCYSLNSSINRDICVYHLAYTTSDFAYCPNISNATIREVCALDANYSTNNQVTP